MTSHNVAENRLIGRAIRCGWDTPKSVKDALISKIKARVQEADLDMKEVRSIAHIVLAIDDINLKAIETERKVQETQATLDDLAKLQEGEDLGTRLP